MYQRVALICRCSKVRISSYIASFPSKLLQISFHKLHIVPLFHSMEFPKIKVRTNSQIARLAWQGLLNRNAQAVRVTRAVAKASPCDELAVDEKKNEPCAG